MCELILIYFPFLTNVKVYQDETFEFNKTVVPHRVIFCSRNFGISKYIWNEGSGGGTRGLKKMSL
jgi:hypothetical protein